MLIFLISIAPTCYITGVQFYKAYVSMPVNKNQLNLSDEELSDGLAVFSPLDSWELDTIYHIGSLSSPRRQNCNRHHVL